MTSPFQSAIPIPVVSTSDGYPRDDRVAPVDTLERPRSRCCCAATAVLVVLKAGECSCGTDLARHLWLRGTCSALQHARSLHLEPSRRKWLVGCGNMVRKRIGTRTETLGQCAQSVLTLSQHWPNLSTLACPGFLCFSPTYTKLLSPKMISHKETEYPVPGDALT